MTVSSTARTESRLVSLARGVSGILVGGLVVLALVVLGVAVLATRRAVDGPGPTMVVVHVVVAITAVVVQVLGDHGGPRRAVGACAVVVALSAALLWTQWWA